MGICSSNNTGVAPQSEEEEIKNAGGPKVVLIHGMASCALDSFVDPVECGCICPRDGLGLALPCTYERGKWNPTWINIEEAVTGFHRVVGILKLKPAQTTLEDGTPCDSMVCPDHVQIRPYPGVAGISQLNPKEPVPIAVWKGLTDELDKLGFNMIALNYDWRRWGDPKMVEEYVAMFKQRIEQEVGSGQPVPIIGHSMGCTVTTYCLSVLGPAWARRHVSKIVLVGMVMQGVPKVTAALGHTPLTIVGNLPFTAPKAIEGIVTDTMATWPCLVTTFPQRIGGEIQTWAEDDPLIVCPSKKYTVSSMADYLEGLGMKADHTKKGLRMWKSWASISHRIKAPIVETHVMYGKGFDTATQVTFPDDDFMELPSMTRSEDGDDTATSASTEALCKAWQGAPESNITLHPMDVAHQQLISGPKCVDLITKLLKG